MIRRDAAGSGNASSTPAKSGSASSTTQPSSSNDRRFASTTRGSPARTECRRGPCHHATRTPLKLAFERRAESRAVLVDRQRIARVGPGDRAQEQRDVGDRSRHRARRPTAATTSRRRRHAAGRRPKADDVAERRRIAERAAGVAAVGDRHHAARQRHRRAAAAAAARSSRGRSGLRVAPNTALNVCDPAPNSGVFVLPSVIAPAARMRVTISASRVGTLSL